MNICKIENCQSFVTARGFCKKHYLRWYRHGNPHVVLDTSKGISKAAKTNTKHGCWNHELYPVWHSMMARCYKTHHHKYKNYGGRGVYVCEQWHDIRNFIADMSPRPIGLTLDRINNDGPYRKENCRWATKEQQARNSTKSKLTDDIRVQIINNYEKYGSPKKVAEMLSIQAYDVKNVVYKIKKLKTLQAALRP